MTYNSALNPELKEENKKSENFTVQMEVNIVKLNKNPKNLNINLNQTNIVSQGVIVNNNCNIKNEIDIFKEEIKNVKKEETKKKETKKDEEPKKVKIKK